MHDAIQNYQEAGQYRYLQRTERPKKIPKRGVRYLKRLVKGDECLSAAKIRTDLNASLPKSV